ncbi:AP1M2 protein, partial [Alaudala cheleensis]|nr:AP1M2 protein [Alaudala cheleensis]
LLSRSYRGDAGPGDIEPFLGLLRRREEEGTLSPVLTCGQVHFLWIQHNNLYCILRGIPPGTPRDPQRPLPRVFREYFKELEEESVRDNFVIVYELLDELMDFGFPQTTESKILQEYITQEGNKLDTGRTRVPSTVTNAVSWRSEGLRYKKNEVFIDVIEAVNLLNKSVELEDVKFHQCVRLSRFDSDRTIAFIPPDGDFELMSYRLHTQVKPLIWIESVIEKFSHSRVEIMVKAKGQFKKQSVANGVEISVPVPSDADSPKFKSTAGSARYLPERNVVIWSIKSFP